MCTDGSDSWTDQAHQSIVLILLLATPTMMLAMELLAHAMIVRHGAAQPDRVVDRTRKAPG